MRKTDNEGEGQEEVRDMETYNFLTFSPIWMIHFSIARLSTLLTNSDPMNNPQLFSPATGTFEALKDYLKSC